MTATSDSLDFEVLRSGRCITSATTAADVRSASSNTTSHDAPSDSGKDRQDIWKNITHKGNDPSPARGGPPIPDGAVEAVWGLLQLAGIAESGIPSTPDRVLLQPLPTAASSAWRPRLARPRPAQERWLSLTGAAALLLTAAPLAASMSRT